MLFPMKLSDRTDTLKQRIPQPVELLLWVRGEKTEC